MRIAIMGSGGVGGYFGAWLAQGGADVTFIARGAHLAAMRADGLRIEGTRPLHLKEVSATDDPATIEPVDLVFLSVKLWDTQAALDQLRPMLGPQTAVVSFQNGVQKETVLREALGPAQVMGGSSYISAQIERPGLIRHIGAPQRLVFGEYDGTVSDRASAFRAACEAGGINCELSQDITADIWGKFVFLVGFSAATSAMRHPIGAIRQHPQTRAFLADVMREVAAVARARGVDLPEDFVERRMRAVDALAPETMASMAHDLQRGNRLELGWLSGAVPELGAAFGVHTPLNRAVAAILALQAHGSRSPA